MFMEKLKCNFPTFHCHEIFGAEAETNQQILTSCSELVLLFARVSHSLTDSQNIQPINQSELRHFFGEFSDWSDNQ